MPLRDYLMHPSTVITKLIPSSLLLPVFYPVVKNSPDKILEQVFMNCVNWAGVMYYYQY